MGANEALQTILSDVDLGALLLRPLTVLEAGRLSGACRRARELVRRGEADEQRFCELLRLRRYEDRMIAVMPRVSEEETLANHAETNRWAEKHRVFLPMWNTEHVLARLERYRMPFFASGGLAFRETTSLARLLLQLLSVGIIELRFAVHFARRGQRPSLLGCHQMHVMDLSRFTERIIRWAVHESSWFTGSDAVYDDVGRREARQVHPGSYMLDLLRELGLRPHGFNPFNTAPVALPPHARDYRVQQMQVRYELWVNCGTA